MWVLLAPTAAGADLAVGPAQTYTTIADALAVAVTGDRVLVDPGVYPEPRLDVDGAAVEIRAALGPGTVTIQATQDKIVKVNGNGSLTLADLTLDGEGARQIASVDGSNLTLEGCTLTAGDAGVGNADGGAIVATNAVLVATGTTFAGNTATGYGGAVALVGTAATFTSTTFSLGDARFDGGAVHAVGSTVVADASAFESNTAQDGAAVAVSGGSLTVVRSSFVGHTAEGAGTIACDGADACDVSDSHFEGNAAVVGSALDVQNTVATTFLSSTVCASTGEWLVDLDGTTASVRNNVWMSNDVSQAVLAVAATATADIVNNTFVTTSATEGGTAVRVEGTATFTNNLVAWNDGTGSAISNAGSFVGTYGWYWDNFASNANFALDATDTQGADPGLPEPPPEACDRWLLVPPAGSPLVDAGDPKRFDADGTRSDIGAFGGDGAPVVVDADKDGWFAGLDCDDANAAVNPGVPEVPCNGLDDDCDPSSADDADADADGTSTCEGDCDDTDPGAADTAVRYDDLDDDGFGAGDARTVCGDPPLTAPADGDCDDADPTAYPGAVEVPYDGVDQDCDGVDLDDLDGDGALGADDCDDEDPERSPGADDVPDDGIDQDCTGRDARATLIGGSGVRCGCAAGPRGGLVVVGLAGLFARRRGCRPGRGA